MYKMVVSNFSEALINQEEAISFSTMLEIERIRNQKVKFVVSTGNSLRDVLDYNKDFNFVDYVIYFYGACIYDVKKEKIISKKNIGVNGVKKIYKLFKEFDILFYIGDVSYHVDDKYEEFFSKYKSSIYKAKVYNIPKEEYICLEKVLESWKKNFSIYTSCQNDFYTLEIVSSQVSPYISLEKIIKQEGILLEEVIAVGASISDVEVVEKCGLGVCVQNGCEEVKVVADEIADSNDKKGVEKIIRKYC